MPDCFGANSAWSQCAAIAHNLFRTANVFAGQRHAAALSRRGLQNQPIWGVWDHTSCAMLNQLRVCERLTRTD
jgi:hypothetical protein